MKCDIIIYSNEAAVGLKFIQKNRALPIVMFKVWAKKCAANNYLSEWQSDVLEKILQKAEYFESNRPVTRHFMYERWEGTSIDDVMKKFFSSLYENHFFKAGKTLSEEPYFEETQKDLKKEIQRILQKPNNKSLVLKQVHCSKYLKRTKSKYCLERNELDNEWYYRQMDKEETAFEKAVYKEVEAWKHNIKYELKECEFSGVVAKIEMLQFSTLLGVDPWGYECYYAPYSDFKPTKEEDFSIPVASVFYQNGRKRLVPLTCIKEYEGFCNGANIERVIKNIEEVENFGSKNLITQKEDSSIEIENSFLYLDTDFNVNKANRKLVLDVENRTSLGDKTTDEMFIKISDEEYKSVLDMMKEQMKQECGFEPKLVYGETNYDRLINFANCPFAPELNVFRNDIPRELWKDLARSPDCVRKFIKLCGLPYTPKAVKILLSGHRRFVNFLGIWRVGFRDERAIDFLMNLDEIWILGSVILENGYFDNFVLTISSESFLFEGIQFLFNHYDEMTCAKLTSELARNCQNGSRAMDALEYMINLAQENNLSEQIIKKIGCEGFTQYNHDMLMRVYRQAHPEQKEQFENLSIEYSAEEKQLEWEKDGYKFCLPEDTNRLVDIGYRMNICVGHLYREKAAQKQCDIVYATKNDEYELCVELRKTSANRFEVVQKSAFSNREPKGKLLAAFNSWRAAKNVG